MTSDERRGSIQPEDWPNEEGSSEESQAGLRDDIGVSSQEPRADDMEPAGAGQDGDRGKLGSTTPGERGTDADPR
jgi:hypothetical protein